MRVVCAIAVVVGMATIAGAATTTKTGTAATPAKTPTPATTGTATTPATLALPHSTLVPGGILVTPIDAPANRPPVVTYDGKRAMVLRSDDRWIAVVGLPLAITPGHANIQVQSGDAPEVPVEFDVVDKQYSVQSLKVAPG